ncbi:S8 family serine peptidase [Clostridium senegalense]|uniref:S8 family serine peptidase n=1 Tax=Clostridium senegalense TaxID=1465809 RepID=UPI0002895AB4|nr:S8 family serine peptidase [Clostridium senegalense]
MHNKFRKNLSKVITVALLASLTMGSIPSMAKAEEADKLLNMPLSVETKEKILKDFESYLPEVDTILKNNENQEEVIRVIVEVKGQSAQEMLKGAGEVTQSQKLMVEDSQKPVKDAVSNLEDVNIRHSYTNVFNGFSAEVKRKDIKTIENIPGVKKVVEVQRYKEDMNSARKLTQIENVWKKYSMKGEGMVVAIVDTGIDYKHKDFKNPDDSSKLKLNKEKVEGIKASGVLKADKNATTYFTEKIPFGYNYADKNNEIVDLRDAKSPHGAHVAGIVGADGDEKLMESNQSVKGVAPEVQLLAMKVFSNGPNGQYTYSDDQLAAIDDAVSLGADVINMSLGAPAGYRKDSDPVQDAIRRATDAGVMVVVSAGNSGYSTDPYGLGTLNDQITVGDPALAKDAFMVASYENSNIANKIVSFKDGNGKVVSQGSFKDHQVDFESIYNKDYEITDGGVGNKTDLGSVRGKVALIKRGELGFTDKILNAQSKGAIGVIVYNTDGDESLINMATDPNIKIPAIFVGNSTGTKILDASKNDKVYFNGDITSSTGENPNAADCSEFTSWGPSPSLEFKPQVAAPGGQIFSTLNEGSHGTMSGTSMSAPHVSGSMALLLQAIKEYAPELKGRELTDYAKNIMMNTSAVKMDKSETPYSPRRQGAGLIQVEDAVKNKVMVTNNGEAAVALKEIKGNKATFTLDIKNYGNEKAEYNIESLGGVLTQRAEDKAGEMIKDVILSDKEANLTFDKNTISIAPKESVKVEVTLNIGSSMEKDKYLEGYIKLNSKNSASPSLNIPYMGFYGEWDKESMITNNAWDKDKHKLVNTLIADGKYSSVLVENLALSNVRRLGKDSINILGVVGQNPDKTYQYDGSKIAISPNGDRVNDVIYPALYLMRNAKSVNVDILDSNGKVVRTLGEVNNLRKNLIATEQGQVPTVIPNLVWDGKVFNSSTGRFVTAANGQYTYRVKMKIDYIGAKDQIVDIPVKVDTKSPWFSAEKYEDLGDGKVKVYFKAVDEESGILDRAKFPVLINGELNKEATDAKVEYDSNTGLYSKVINGLDPNGKNEITIGILDYANNLGGGTVSIDLSKEEPKQELKEEGRDNLITFDDKNFAENKVLSDNETYKIAGKVNESINEIIINDAKVELVKDNSQRIIFKYDVKLNEGENLIKIVCKDSNGKVVVENQYKVNYEVKK